MRMRMSRRVLLVLGVVGGVVTAGCATSSRRGAFTRMDTVRIPDTASVSTTSSLVVVVRRVDRPDTPVEGAQVRMAAADAPAASLAAMRDSLAPQGRVSFIDLTPGDYDVLVRRVGMGAAHVRIVLPAGCSSTLEVYLVAIACDIGWCPPSPTPRVTFTTCSRVR